MGSLQDMDHLSLMRSITKWAVQVPETRRIVEYIDSAFRVAQANVPGPVFLEMPLDLLMNFADDARCCRRRARCPSLRAPRATRAAIERAAELLRVAERPVFLVGSQLRWSPAARRRAARRRRLRGALLPERHGARRAAPTSTAVSSRARASSRSPRPTASSSSARRSTSASTTGARPPGRRTRKIVQVDLDGAELGRNRRVDVAIDGDSGARARAARSPRWAPRRRARGSRRVRADEDKRRAKMLAEIESNDSPPNPLRVCAELGKRLKPERHRRRATAATSSPRRRTCSSSSGRSSGWTRGRSARSASAPGTRWPRSSRGPTRASSSSTATGASACTAMEFEAMARQKIPVVALIGNDAGVDADPPRSGRDVRRAARGRDGARLHALREGRRGVRGHGASGSRRVEQLGPALDEAFACGVPACVNVKIAKSDFRKGAISV